VFHDALAGDNSEAYEAAVTGLCNWPDPSGGEELLKLAQGAKDASHRQKALRALIRVHIEPSDTPAIEKLPLLKKAMELATRDEERKMNLEGTATVRHIETLR